jgi:hypothetical protein
MLSLRRQGFNPKAELMTTRPGHRFTDASLWKCGARVGRINATFPLAMVTFDRDWLRVEGVPTCDVWVDRARVSSIQPVRYLWSNGIRFVAPDGRYDGLIIWTRAGMTGELRSAGWQRRLPDRSTRRSPLTRYYLQ